MFLAAYLLAISFQSKLDAQAAQLFAWYDKLGYAKYLTKPFVRVGEAGDRSKDSWHNHGFLIREDAKTFDLLELSLAIVTYAKKGGTSWPSEYSYKPADFTGLARRTIKGRSEPILMDRPETIDGSIGDGPGPDDAPLAWICFKKNLVPESNFFLKVAEDNVRGSLPKRSFVSAGQQAVVSSELWNAESHLVDSNWTRPKQVKEFQRLADKFGNAEGAKEFQNTVVLLNKMETIDKLRSRRPIEQLPIRQRIKELIWRLQDNKYDLAWMSHDDDKSTFSQLKNIGYPAVPQLIDALGDLRPTKATAASMTFHRYPRHGGSVIRVQDVAEKILEEIAHQDFGRNGNGPNLDLEIRKWYQEFQKKGERQLTLDAVRRGGPDSFEQAEVLVKKYPSIALKTIIEGYQNANLSNRSGLIMALDPLPSATVSKFLHQVIDGDKGLDPKARVKRASTNGEPDFDSMEGRKEFGIRIKAIVILGKHEPEFALSAMQREWAHYSEEDDHTFVDEEMISFLLNSRRLIAFESLMKDLKSRPVSLRLQVIESTSSTWNDLLNKQKLSKEEMKQSGKRLEDLLASELDDNERANGSMSISSESLTISFVHPRISEYTLYTLAQFLPKAYKFKKTNSATDQERQRLVALNTYRSRRGLKAMAVRSEPVHESIPLVKLKPFLDRVIAGRDQEAMDAIVKYGISAFSTVQRAIRATPNAGAKSRLEEALHQIASTVSSVTVTNAVSASERQVAAQLGSFKGKVLNSNILCQVLRILSTGIEKQGTRPLMVTAERSADSTGFILTVTYNPHIKQAETTMAIEGLEVRGGSIGGDSFSQFENKDVVDSIQHCLNTSSTKCVLISFEFTKSRYGY